VLLCIALIALAGAHWWTVLPVVLGVFAFHGLIRLRRRFTNLS
jgi:hypothetical protein